MKQTLSNQPLFERLYLAMDSLPLTHVQVSPQMLSFINHVMRQYMTRSCTGNHRWCVSFAITDYIFGVSASPESILPHTWLMHFGRTPSKVLQRCFKWFCTISTFLGGLFPAVLSLCFSELLLKSACPIFWSVIRKFLNCSSVIGQCSFHNHSHLSRGHWLPHSAHVTR